MFQFVEQKVSLMTQLIIYIFNSYKEGSRCTNKEKKLPFMLKCIIRFVAIKFQKKVTYVISLFVMFLMNNWRGAMSIKNNGILIIVYIRLALHYN